MSSSSPSFEDVRSTAEMCEKLVDDTAQGRYTEEEFMEELRKTGVSVHEAVDYIQSYRQRIELQQSVPQPRDSNTLSSSSHTRPENDPADHIRAITPEGLDDVQTASFRARRTQELDRTSVPQQPLSSTDVNDENLPPPVASSSIPSSVLAIAPHLASLSRGTSFDDHLLKTWKLRQAYCTEKAIEPIIDLMQCQLLSDPIPRSIWRKIILDEFVDFERLYGSTDRNYSHQDDQKEFAGGYVLTKKEQISTKKSIKSEAEWIRMFSAWEAAVLHLFPHRHDELQNYRAIIIDFFRATPHNSSIAIQFDIEVRDRYARSPYHLDNRDMLHIPLLTQLFRGSNSSFKRDSDSSYPSTSKRAMVPCQNWSLGICDDPCLNRRRHGVCSECGGRHRAKEVDGCREKLQDKRREGKEFSLAAGRGGNRRA
ncbi:hypothetical protein BYT27DRAFT_7081763 [Phlegmacium glaucopus]|nr:hypothetical protein BYT27DRAFT_7081763 [Phlegmacium glaucopus]